MKDLSGLKINRWTILSFSHFKKYDFKSRKNAKINYWNIQCECGTLKTRPLSDIRKNKSCGCYRKEKGRYNTSKIKIGKVFGFLEVLEVVGSTKDTGGNVRTNYKCKCICGQFKTIPSSYLRRNKNPSCGCKGYEISDPTVVINSIYSDYTQRAKRKKIQIDINRADFGKLIDLPCHYCGTLKSNLKTVHTGKKYAYNGLDRIDVTKGYTLDNVVTCCKDCNIAKSELSYDEYKNFIKRVYEFLFLV